MGTVSVEEANDTIIRVVQCFNSDSVAPIFRLHRVHKKERKEQKMKNRVLQKIHTPNHTHTRVRIRTHMHF